MLLLRLRADDFLGGLWAQDPAVHLRGQRHLRATGPITVTEHDDAVWADPGDLPAVSDETRGLLAG
ncbi:hypothetical protein AB0393_31865 [Streptomyces cyaneofuscatus]|uniref:hypothetical protein n=1 Tax=Streptomyces cyaneofuscatus TaxID=66883 RepID=UPI00344C9933